MGLFDIFKKKEATSTPTAPPTPPPQLQKAFDDFEKEMMDVMARYYRTPENRYEVGMKTKDGQQASPALFFQEEFFKWIDVKSLADRRGILYGILDKLIGGKMKRWQVTERFTDDRY